VLVEGAGGLLVPYADDLLAADVARALDLPLLIVARASLGTINHTLLTISEARHRNLRVRGVILSRVVPERGPDELDNAAEIERLGKVAVLGTIPHLGESVRRRPDVLATALARAFDPTVLLG
jgi:dethiobiotin synthetase